MPTDWTLVCYGCATGHGNNLTGPDAIAHWTFPPGPAQVTIGLCRKCLNEWLDNADNGTTDEPAQLTFLVAPDKLMAAA